MIRQIMFLTMDGVRRVNLQIGWLTLMLNRQELGLCRRRFWLARFGLRQFYMVSCSELSLLKQSDTTPLAAAKSGVM